MYCLVKKYKVQAREYEAVYVHMSMGVICVMTLCNTLLDYSSNRSSAAEYGIWLARALGNDTTLLETLKKKQLNPPRSCAGF